MGAAGRHRRTTGRGAFACALALGLAAALGLMLAGAQPALSGHPNIPPNTKWINPAGSPKWKGKPKGRISARRPIFRFRSSQHPQRLQRYVCRRDNLRWTRCGNRVQPKRKLPFGKHVFRVYTVNEFGLKDPTPARTYFTIVRKR